MRRTRERKVKMWDAGCDVCGCVWMWCIRARLIVDASWERTRQLVQLLSRDST